MPDDRGDRRRSAALRHGQGEQGPAARDGGRGVALSPRVILVGKPGCHLCDVAREVIELVCAQAGADWIEVSIQDDPRLAARYAEQIPVILVDGQIHDIYRVNPQRLRAALGAE